MHQTCTTGALFLGTSGIRESKKKEKNRTAHASTRVGWYTNWWVEKRFGRVLGEFDLSFPVEIREKDVSILYYRVFLSFTIASEKIR